MTPPWVTLLAASIAAAAAVVAAVLAAVSAARGRSWTRRDQWWQHAQWAIEKALSSNAQESEVGLAVLTKLVRLRWAQPEDNEIALVVADLISDRPNRSKRKRG